MKNENNEMQIELTPEIAEGIYSNLAIISHSSSEFVVDFVRLMPGVPKAPEHAKRLMFAIEENILKYEKQFGPIRMNDNNNNMPPFMAPGGEA